MARRTDTRRARKGALVRPDLRLAIYLRNIEGGEVRNAIQAELERLDSELQPE